MESLLSGKDIANLKAYVASNETGMQRAESTTLLHVTHSNLNAKFFEIRLDLHMTVGNIKHKLSTMCGTPPSLMSLLLKDEAGKVLYELGDDSRMLGYYSPHDGYTIHIVDLDPGSLSANGWLEDVSKVEKYVISEEAYNAREKTYRKFKADKLKADPEWCIEKEMAMRKGKAWEPPPPPKIYDQDSYKEEAESIHVGERCSAEPGDRRGVVQFVGRVEGLPAGFWVGVQYDEPLGKNDGTVKGKQFFECPLGYGGFVRPDKVKTGDFPPLDEDLLGSDDEI